MDGALELPIHYPTISQLLRLMMPETSFLALIGGLGLPEIGLIIFVIVLLFGAKKLPQLARSFGQSLGEFKKGREESKLEEESTSTASKSNETSEKPSESSVS